MTNSRRFRTALAGAIAAALAVPGAAFAAVDFSGFWMLKSDPWSVPTAAATPAAAAKFKELNEAQGIDAPNGSPAYARMWCTPEGVPYQELHTLPIDIRQGPRTISETFNVISDIRHIYIDGQSHPDLDVFDRTANGNSVGRWQGNTLVVDTIGFSADSGVETIPGGALRSENSHLVERWRLVDHDTLRITYTWTDPTTLRRPHTYTLEFGRMDGPVWMTEPQCSPIQAMRRKGLFLPPDAPQF